MKKRLKQLLVSTVIVALSASNIVFVQAKDVDNYSKSSILIDQTTNRVLYQKEADTKRPLASLSKMMTFLIALEAIENNEVKKDDIITIDKSISKVRGSSYKLKEGEKIPLIELMKGLMVVSGNDAAVAIAKHISKDEAVFIKRMNNKAKEIGMNNTSFVNPHGLPIYDLNDPKALPKENISTAKDIAILGKYLFDNYEKEVLAITDMYEYSYPERGFYKNNTNPLLGTIDEVDGIKTGYTGNAGYCLAFSMMIKEDENNDINHRLIGVVLGTNHKNKRLSASLDLLKHGKNNFKVSNVLDDDESIGKKYIKGLDELEVRLKTKEDLCITIGKEEKINVQTTLKELNYPIEKGDVIGVIKYYNEKGEILGSVDVVSENEKKDISLITKKKMIFTD